MSGLRAGSVAAAFALSVLAPAVYAAPTPAPDGTVTVTAKRTQPCDEKDHQCIVAVAKEAWARYPVQLETYCEKADQEREQQQANIAELLGGGSAIGGAAGASLEHGLPPALKIVCEYQHGDAALPPAANWVPWTAVPSAADLAAVYPAKAKVDAGDAHINCRINDKGRLVRCSLAAETPDRQGFGAAAMKLADKFQVNAGVATMKRAEPLWLDVAIHLSRTPGAPPSINPDWTILPDPAVTATLYPADATKAGVTTGVGKVDCQVAENGALGGCVLVSEEPAALGFGPAALATAPRMRVNLWTRDGQRAAGSHVIVPLRFDAPTAPSGS